jgi:hypothetical protein
VRVLVSISSVVRFGEVCILRTVVGRFAVQWARARARARAVFVDGYTSFYVRTGFRARALYAREVVAAQRVSQL